MKDAQSSLSFVQRSKDIINLAKSSRVCGK
jgi:hypothetical protein